MFFFLYKVLHFASHRKIAQIVHQMFGVLLNIQLKSNFREEKIPYYEFFFQIKILILQFKFKN